MTTSDAVRRRRVRDEELRRLERIRAENVEREVRVRTMRVIEEPCYTTVDKRCRICSGAASHSVNMMLAHGMTYADILIALEPVNELLPVDRRITVHMVNFHARKHFPIEAAAQAAYRKVVEARAKEAGKDFVMGVNGALTPIAYLDIVMRKGFETLVDNNTKVEVETGMKAARDLQALTKDDQASADVAELMLKLNILVEAVKTSVPEELWPMILAKIEGREDVIDVEVDDAVGYDPGDPDFGDDNAADHVPDDPEANEDIGHF